MLLLADTTNNTVVIFILTVQYTVGVRLAQGLYENIKVRTSYYYTALQGLFVYHLLHVADIICHHNEMEFLVMYYQAT